MRFNRALTEEINKKVLKTLGVHTPLLNHSERNRSLVSVNCTLVGVTQVKIIMRLTEKKTEFNQVKPRITKTFTRNSAEFNRVKLDKLSQEIDGG